MVLQSNALNQAGHASTILVPGTSQLSLGDGADLSPLRVRVASDKASGLRQPTELLIDQVRAVSNRRPLRRLGTVSEETLARVEQALRWLIGVSSV